MKKKKQGLDSFEPLLKIIGLFRLRTDLPRHGTPAVEKSVTTN